MEVTHAQDEATLTVADAARITRLSADTIRRYSNAGTLATFRTPGNQRRFRDADVRALLTPQSAPLTAVAPGAVEGVSSSSDAA